MDEIPGGLILAVISSIIGGLFTKSPECFGFVGVIVGKLRRKNANQIDKRTN